jgi:hypothetical protein
LFVAWWQQGRSSPFAVLRHPHLTTT